MGADEVSPSAASPGSARRGEGGVVFSDVSERLLSSSLPQEERVRLMLAAERESLRSQSAHFRPRRGAFVALLVLLVAAMVVVGLITPSPTETPSVPLAEADAQALVSDMTAAVDAAAARVSLSPAEFAATSDMAALGEVVVGSQVSLADGFVSRVVADDAIEVRSDRWLVVLERVNADLEVRSGELVWCVVLSTQRLGVSAFNTGSC